MLLALPVVGGEGLLEGVRAKHGLSYPLLNVVLVLQCHSIGSCIVASDG